MPVSVKGGIELRKALKQFTPDLAKDTQKQLGVLLKPITAKARGFIPSNAPLSGWGKTSIDGTFPEWRAGVAKRGVGYKTTPSKPNRQGWRSLARIVNASPEGAIYETAGRVNAHGRDQNEMVRVNALFHKNYGKIIRASDKTKSRSNNPGAGEMFIDAMNQYSEIADARALGTTGRPSRKMKGRAIFRAWKEEGGKTNAAVIKAIEDSRDKFYAAVGKN
jgi:hypothetical protein